MVDQAPLCGNVAGNGGIATRILNFGTKLNRVVSLTLKGLILFYRDDTFYCYMVLSLMFELLTFLVQNMTAPFSFSLIAESIPKDKKVARAASSAISWISFFSRLSS
jgi:hypothetical protein